MRIQLVNHNLVWIEELLFVLLIKLYVILCKSNDSYKKEVYDIRLTHVTVEENIRITSQVR